MPYLLLLMLLIVSTLSGCRKNSDEISCGLKQALIEEDERRVGEYITSLCSRLPPGLGKDDLTTRKAQIDELIQKLNGECGVKVTTFCFECIKTLPPMTEVKLEYLKNGEQAYRTIDIAAVYGGVPRYVGMHE